MIGQKFEIVPHGMVKGGSCAYQVDPETGNVTADGSIKAGLAWSVATHEDHQALKVDPTRFLSANVTKDKVIQAGAVTLKVDELKSGTAKVSVSIDSDSIKAKGTATLNLAAKYIVLTNVTLVGSYGIFPVTLELKPV